MNYIIYCKFICSVKFYVNKFTSLWDSSRKDISLLLFELKSVKSAVCYFWNLTPCDWYMVEGNELVIMEPLKN